MEHWLHTQAVALSLVVLAAFFDIGANLLLKKSQGFTHKGYTLACVAMVCVAFTLLALGIEVIPLSVAYTTWGAVGIIGTTLGGYVFLKERLSFIGYLGIAMVICGVVLLHIEF